jgi:hypothetical protein
LVKYTAGGSADSGRRGGERRLEMEGRGALELGHTCDSLYEWQRGRVSCIITPTMEWALKYVVQALPLQKPFDLVTD